MRARRFVVVSGLPASGKSTLARALAGPLGIAVIDKDDYLETLLDQDDGFDPARRSRLSRAADETLRAHAAQIDEAILVSFWRRMEVSASTGTPIDWLFSLPNVVEVYCACEPAVAVERFMRRQRHPGHGDTVRSVEALTAQFDAHAKLGPLGIGPVITVDTTQPTDIQAVVERIRHG